MNKLVIKTPIDITELENLKCGDAITLSGVVYTARDMAHKRLVEMIDKGQTLPFDINGQTIYYAGPSKCPPGRVIGSCGPTTSYRMDSYTPRLLSLGLRAMIGKGRRSRQTIDAMVKYKAVYLGALGGAGALLAAKVVKCEAVAFCDLGAEAVHRLEICQFPVTVITDMFGNSLL